MDSNKYLQRISYHARKAGELADKDSFDTKLCQKYALQSIAHSKAVEALSIAFAATKGFEYE